MVKEIGIGIYTAVVVFLGFIGVNILPLIFVGAIVVVLYVLAEVRGIAPPNVAKPKHRPVEETVPKTSFDDVGGHARTKAELKEALDFLMRREKIEAYGIRPIKGILLSGPPGTGKTLLAKAAAHYTDSVFVPTSGSEFVEMYVGVGAKRIRKLFAQARELARKNRKKSGIVFIDEIDVIGGKREGSDHREYDQTLNQLLTEMDGIETARDVRLLVIAATNRPDMLDAALMRPGRFDRHIYVDLPDKQAREHILRLHLKNKPLASEVDITQIARETFGFSGAELESLANEAAIYALRQQSDVITSAHLAEAIDKVIMGERADRKPTKTELERVAVHEIGHAVASELICPGSVSHVALSPRGKALGYVRQFPLNDQYLYTRADIEGQIKIALAGAVAEEIVYGSYSTGAQNDFEQANLYTVTMIENGWSDLGILNVKLASKEKMQDESSRILQAEWDKTKALLKQYRSVLSDALSVLLKEEVISGEQFRQLLTLDKEQTRRAL